MAAVNAELPAKVLSHSPNDRFEVRMIRNVSTSYGQSFQR